MHYSVYNSGGVPRPSRRWKILWWLMGVGLAGLIAWFATGPIVALRKIQDEAGRSESFFGFLGKITSGQQLKGEREDRINILLIGIGGKNHPGGTLADTIQVVSIAPRRKQIAILSIPRDLQVVIPGAGTNKINYAHAWGELNPQRTGGGPAVTKEVVSRVLGLPIHYYVRMDFEGFVKLVDALGGVDIYVEKAINDPFYPAPDMIRYDPFRISAGQHHLDGKTALKYVRSRETTSDFDRSRRQQQMLQALKERALTLDILANPRKVNEIAAILGEHVKTDLTTWEMARAVEMAARDASQFSVYTRVLAAGAGEPLVPVNNGGYFLVPRTGTFEEIQSIAENIFDLAVIEQEKAAVEVVNASGRPATLQAVVTALRNQGYTVAATRTAPTVTRTVIYDYSGDGKPRTVALLSQYFGVSAERRTRPTGSTLDVTVVLGTDYRPN